MSSLKKLLPNNSDGKFVALFQCLDPETIDVIVANIQTMKYVSKNTFTDNNIKKFIDDIPKLFHSKFVAVILNIFYFNATEYESNTEFCNILREKFSSIEIPTYFMSAPDFLSTTFFIATNTIIELHETAILILDNDDKIAIFECPFTEAGYDKNLIDEIDYDPKISPEAIREKIIRSSNPKKIIFATSSAKSQKTLFFKNQVFNGFSVDVIEHGRVRGYEVQFLVEMSKWLLDKSYTKFYFHPKCGRQYVFVYLTHEKETPTPHVFLSINSNDQLPIEKSACIPRNSGDRKIYLVCIDLFVNKRTVLQEFSLFKKCHLTEIFLTVDSESFPQAKIEPYFIPKLVAMPMVLDESMEPKYPFIGIYGGGNSSVICYCKNDQIGYEFLDTWNGIYGNDLCIAFQNKKGIFGAAVQESENLNPASVIFDIIKIMSMPADNIKVEEFWYFKITKDDENPVLLEFDDFEGNRKLASPAFLMAMLIRQHIKAINAKIGKKPTVLGFCFFDDYNEDEEKRIEEQIKESFELLKIKCMCIFV